MSLLGNIIWLIFGGLFAALGYFLGGLSLCLTIIGIPFGFQCFKLGIAVLTPFGKEVVELPDAYSPIRIILNVLWVFTMGWMLAVGHVVVAIFLALTIIGLPFAYQNLKLVPLALLPFGHDLR